MFLRRQERWLVEKTLALKLVNTNRDQVVLLKLVVKKYNRETGSNLKPPQPEGGPRKRSFCARMGGVKGPMKDSKGRPTRKALALRKWKC